MPMAYSINYAQLPDFGGTMLRGEQMAQQRQMNALQMLAQQRELERAQQVDNALRQYAPNLGSQDPALRGAAINGLLQSGAQGARIALPMLQEERYRAELGGDSPAGAVVAPAPTQATAQPARRLPGGDDLDAAVRTVIGEAGNQGPDGWRAVAAVIRNRSGSGRSIRDVVLAPGQFEPWQTRRGELEAIDPNSPQYQQVRAVIAPVLAGVAPDPTNGATHFLNPDIVRQRTGGTLPAWAQGDGQRIGDHMFYRVGYQPAGGAPAQAASAPATAGGLPAVPGFDMARVERARRLAAVNPIAAKEWQTYREAAGLMAREDKVSTAAPGSAILDRNGNIISTVPERAPDGMTPANALLDIERLAPKIAGGTATENEVRRYLSAASTVQQERVAADGTRITPRLPAYAPGQDWVAQRYGISGTPAPAAPAAPATPPAPAAPAEVAPPAALTGARIGQTDMTAEPPLPRASGGVQPGSQVSPADRTKLRNIEVEAKGIRDALAEFRRVRSEAGIGERAATAAGLPTKLSTSWSNAALLAKGEALYNLGVLNGADLSIMRRVLADPSTLSGAVAGQGAVDEQIQQIENLLEDRLRTARQQYGGGQASSPAASSRPAGNRPPLSSFQR